MVYANFKISIQYLLLLAFCLSIFSCSLTIEKRRYRPGYHVDILKGYPIRSESDKDKFSISGVKQNNRLLLTIKSTELHLKPVAPVISKTIKENSLNTGLGKTNRIKKANNILSSTNFNRISLRNKLYHLNKTKSLRGRKVAAWVLGGFSMAAVVIGFGMSFISWGGIGLAIFGICLGIAILLALIAIIVRYAGAKKLESENPPPYVAINNKFINVSFIISIITLGLSVLGFVFGFFIYPFGVVSFSLGIVSAVAAITSFSLGFRALKDDKSLKTKLTIIFGFIAFVLAIICMILIFL